MVKLEKGKTDIYSLTISYIKVLSNKKVYNVQSIAIKKMLATKPVKEIKEQLNKSVYRFCEDNQLILARDFLYKNDSFTPRNMYVISPIYYAYYTNLVFKIAKKLLDSNSDELNFSNKYMKIYYSGILEFNNDIEKVNSNAIFNKSYNLFKKEGEKHFDKHVIKVDIKDFFNSITIKKLIAKLKSKVGDINEVNELEKFFSYCGFNTLPQLHYSIASSILSQIYLMDFDNKLKEILRENNLYLIRFVDDMYIFKEAEELKLRDVNELLDSINSILWLDDLLLNSSKTKVLKPKEYEENFKLVNRVSFNELSFSSEQIIEDKANEVIDNGNFTDLICQLCELEKNSGIDIKKYLNLLDKYISINGEDSNKIINNIIFSGKWKRLSPNDLMKLTGNWRYILFNPSQFTVLFVLINRYLERHKIVDGSNIKKLLSYMFRRVNYKFRETLVIVAYLFQNKKKNKELLDKIKYLNNNYVEFIECYI